MVTIRSDTHRDRGTSGSIASARPFEPTPPRTGPSPRSGLLPLTHGQEALWYLDRLDPTGGAHTIAVAARVATSLDPDALIRAAHDLAARHPALRASVVDTPEGPRQRIADAPRIDASVVDLRAVPLADVPARIARDAYRPFDLARGPLVRLVLYRRLRADPEADPDGWDFLLALHHLISDLGSFEVIARDLGVLYRRRTERLGALGHPDQPSTLPEPAQYGDWVTAERRRIEGAEGERLAAWWAERVPEDPPPLELPSDRARPALQGHRGHAVSARLDAATARRLGRFARRHRASLSTVLLAAYQALLHRLSGQSAFAVGVPTAGRKSRQSAELVGYLVNPVVVTSDLDRLASADPTFAEMLAAARERLVAAVEHRDHPFPLLARRVRPERDPSRSSVFQAMFVHQRVRGGGLGAFHLAHPGTRLDLGGAVVTPIRLPGDRSQVDVRLSSAEVRTGPTPGVALELQVAADLFDRATARRWLRAFEVLLAAAVEAPETPVAGLPLLGSAERAAVLTEWPSSPDVRTGDSREAHGPHAVHGAQAAPPIHRAFAARAAEVPERIALVGEIGGGAWWSYGELARRMRRGASRLRALGAGPEVRVAVGLERSPALVATLLAVLESGAAYVPVDPALPEARRRLLLRDSGARLLVAGEEPPAGSGDLDRVDPAALFASGADDRTAPEAAALRESLAYLIYTSGSTGTPKAVGIRHRSAAALIAWAGEAFGPEELAGTLAATSVGFDLSVFEIFMPLAAGGTVVLAGSVLDFAHLPERRWVTLVNTVPSALEEVVRLRPLPASVRAVNLAGEPLPETLAAEVHRQLAAGGRLSNLYAPSESTTYSTGSTVPSPIAAGPGGPPAIGRPLPGERVHVAGPDLEPVPIGVPGELVLGGVGIARGYLGRPAATAECFVPDPFAPAHEPGARLYRTGDVGWWRADGELRFGGRRDHQVKVRGFRVELGEVEAALGGHPEVAQAVVAATERRDALRAFVLPASETVSVDALGRWLAERLPAALVPRSFALVASFPRTASGKIDRRALLAEVPEPGLGGGPEAERVAPRTPVEEAVAALFREVLELPPDAPLGVHDDLFRLGGHSLLAARLAARVRESLGAELPLRTVIARPTVAGLASAVAGGRGTAEPIPPVADPVSPPLSYSQERLWFLDRLDPGSARYNMPVGLRLRGRLDLAALAAALDGLAARHAPLRSRFGVTGGPGVQGGEPTLRIEPPDDPPGSGSRRRAPLPVADLSGLGAAAAAREAERAANAAARRPLPLCGAPPVRRLLVRSASADHLLVLVVHHAVADGWSLRVVLPRDLEALYRGEPLAPPPITYGDFAHWQRHRLSGERSAGRLDTLLAHWRERLAGLVPLELATDRPRVGAGSRAAGGRLHPGGAVPVTVPAGVAGRLRELGRRRGATLFTVVLAAYQALLARWAGADDLAVGVAHAQRDRSEVEGLVGLFVDTLVIRAAVPGGEPFTEHLDRVRRSAAAAFAHADLPFERLTEALRGGVGDSLVRAFFAFDATSASVPRLPGLAVERVDLRSATAKFDLALSLEASGGDGEVDGALRGELEYDARLFDRETAEGWGRELAALLERIADDPAVRLGQVARIAQADGPAADGSGPEGEDEAAPFDVDDPIAALAARVWGDVLDLGRPARAAERFFDLGGHSLLGARAVARVAAAAEVDLPVRILFDHPRLDRFVAAVRRARGVPGATVLPRVEPRFDPATSEPFDAPASHAQLRLWFLDRLAPGSPINGMPLAARLEGPASAVELARAFARIARRHAVLRTALVVRAGAAEPVQRVASADGTDGADGAGAGLVPCLADLSGLPPRRATEQSRHLASWEARQPFDLARAPLARAVLVRRSATDHDLLLSLHHVIADGWSLGVLLDELAGSYGAGRRPLPRLPVQYADYAAWLRARLEGGTAGRELSFWRRELDGLPRLDLTGDAPGEPRAEPFAGGHVPLALPGPLGTACRRAARELGATPFLVLLAAFQALLGRVAGQRDFGVATPVANRRRPELEGLIGLFVDTLVLRTDLDAEPGDGEGRAGGPGLRTLVARAHRRALTAFDHQDLPFERLVEALEIPRGDQGGRERIDGPRIDRPPLAQAMLVVQDGPAPSLRLAGLSAAPFDRESGTAKLDLTLSLRRRAEAGSPAEPGDGFEGHLEYAASRFDAVQARRLADSFVALLEAGLEDLDRPYGDLPVLVPAVRRRLVAEAPPAVRDPRVPAPFVPPRDPLEEAVAGLWRELLATERVGIHDDFFGSGGHSLLTVRLASGLHDRLGADLPVATLFQRTTVAAQAAAVREHLAAGSESPARPEPLPAEARRAGIPLAPGQARLLFLDRLQSPGPLYHLPLGLGIDGPIDLRALAGAVGDLVARHEAFRLRVVPDLGHGDGSRDLQVAAAPWRPRPPLVDLTALAAPDAPAAMARAEEAATRAWARRPFDLGSGRLLAPLVVRRGDRDHLLVLSQHHLVSDGWSQGVLVRDLVRFYEARIGPETSEATPAILPPRLQQGDVAAWQLRRRAEDALGPAIEHWRERLAGLRPVELPTDRPRTGEGSHRSFAAPFHLPPAVVERLRAVGRERGVTPFMVLLAGLQAVVARWSGGNDVAVGTPVANRDLPGLADAVAFLVDTLVLRTGLGGDPSFADLLDRVRGTVLDAFVHRDAPFERVVEAVHPERELGRTPLFEVFFAYQDLPAPEPRLGPARLELVPVSTGATQFPVTLVVRPAEAESGGLRGTVSVDLDLFDRTTGRRFAHHLERLLATALADPGQRLAEAGFLGPGERHQLVIEHGRPRTSFPEARPLYEHLQEVARSRADAVALVAGPRCLSFGELARRAAALGAFLRSRGAGPESVVAVIAGRSIDAVIAALGVHDAGACYLPLDPEHPAERLAFSLADAGARWVLTGGEDRARPPEPPGGAPEVVTVAEAVARGEVLAPAPAAAAAYDEPGRPDSRAAYVIYTSGSTGRPKGVVVDQRGLSRLYDSVRARIGYEADDTRAQLHSPAFDFSVWETWGSLTHGGRLVLVPRGVALSPEDLHAFVERERITILGQTPSAFHALQEVDQASPGPGMPDLRLLCLGGEALVPAAVAPWLERHGDRRPRLLNLYGPTETVVMCTHRRIIRGDLRRGKVSPIGDPVADAALHLVDRDARPVPLGTPGEIWVGGAALARGYLRRPALTAERFVPDPFSGALGAPGGRLYRTGDKARRAPDGELEFLGRIDAQVKIRGYRVEPEEVEAMLVGHPGVGAGAVIARAAPYGGHRLIAYVVPRDGRPVGEAELRSALGESLPGYMVPERFVFLDALPRTSSDKVDRRALPEPSSERPGLEAEYRPPRSALEDAIAAVWRDVLGLDRVGVYDNFFDLGGHSLLLGRVHRRLAETLGREIPLIELFRHTTIAGLAEHLEAMAAPEERLEDRRREREQRVDRAMDRRERLAQRRRVRSRRDPVEEDV